MPLRRVTAREPAGLAAAALTPLAMLANGWSMLPVPLLSDPRAYQPGRAL